MNILTRRLLALGAAGSVVLGVAGMAVAQNADANAPEQKPQVRQGHRGMRHRGMHRGMGHGMGRMAGLNLTAEQQEKVKALRQDFHEKFLQVLTPEQRTKLQEMRKNRSAKRGERGMRGMRRMGARRMGGMKQMAEKLNLTDEQKVKFQAARTELRTELKAARSLQGDERKSAHKAAREKFHAVVQSILTPEQQEQMKTLRPARRTRAAAPQAAS